MCTWEYKVTSRGLSSHTSCTFLQYLAGSKSIQCNTLQLSRVLDYKRPHVLGNQVLHYCTIVIQGLFPDRCGRLSVLRMRLQLATTSEPAAGAAGRPAPVGRACLDGQVAQLWAEVSHSQRQVGGVRREEQAGGTIPPVKSPGRGDGWSGQVRDRRCFFLSPLAVCCGRNFCSSCRPDSSWCPSNPLAQSQMYAWPFLWTIRQPNVWSMCSNIQASIWGLLLPFNLFRFACVTNGPPAGGGGRQAGCWDFNNFEEFNILLGIQKY